MTTHIVCLQTVYSMQGGGTSWEWLEMVSPCVNVLHRLVSGMNDTIGSKQGTKHATPDITRDLCELRHSLAEAQVYEMCANAKGN